MHIDSSAHQAAGDMGGRGKMPPVFNISTCIGKKITVF